MAFIHLYPKLIQLIFKNSFRASKKTQYVTVTKISWLRLLEKITAAYSENHMKTTNEIFEKHAKLLSNKVVAAY
jgi:hypothetical protein